MDLIRNKKIILFLLLVSAFLLLPPEAVAASHSKDSASPYGDYCKKYSHYGRNKIMHDHAHAEKALRHYFSKRGLTIKLLERKGRFIKAHVMKNKEIVDTILFDRHTGRIRSIY